MVVLVLQRPGRPVQVARAAGKRRALAGAQDLRGVCGRLADDGRHGRVRREDERPCRSTSCVLHSGEAGLERCGAHRWRPDHRDRQAQGGARPGSAALRQSPLFRGLSQAGLIDLYRLMVHPIVLGRGARLFAENVDRAVLDLAATRPSTLASSSSSTGPPIHRSTAESHFAGFRRRAAGSPPTARTTSSPPDPEHDVNSRVRCDELHAFVSESP